MAGTAASFSPGERTLDELHAIVFRKIGSQVSAQQSERQMRRAGGISGGHPRMRVLFESERSGPALLHRVAQPVQRADARIAAPGKNQFRRAARADQLIVDQIRRHPDQRQIATPLTDDLVPRGEGNQMCEAFERHHITVANHFLDGLFEWKNVSQTVIMPCLERCGPFRAFLVFLAFPLFAHHSTGAYDLKHPATASGVVTSFEWSNPHAHIYLDAAAPDGRVEHWVIEVASPNSLDRVGWSKDSLKPGDQVICSGARAKDGSPRMRCTKVELADGTVLQSY